MCAESEGKRAWNRTWWGHQDIGKSKTPEKQLNEVEIGKLPEKEFRIMIVKMIQDLRKRMEAKINKMKEMFNKHLEELKSKQMMMNNTMKLKIL